MKKGMPQNFFIVLFAILLVINLTGCISVTIDGDGGDELQVSDVVTASKVDEVAHKVPEQADVFQVDSPTIDVVAKISGVKKARRDQL